MNYSKVCVWAKGYKRWHIPAFGQISFCPVDPCRRNRICNNEWYGASGQRDPSQSGIVRPACRDYDVLLQICIHRGSPRESEGASEDLRE